MYRNAHACAGCTCSGRLCCRHAAQLVCNWHFTHAGLIPYPTLPWPTCLAHSTPEPSPARADRHGPRAAGRAHLLGGGAAGVPGHLLAALCRALGALAVLPQRRHGPGRARAAGADTLSALPLPILNHFYPPARPCCRTLLLCHARAPGRGACAPASSGLRPCFAAVHAPCCGT